MQSLPCSRKEANRHGCVNRYTGFNDDREFWLSDRHYRLLATQIREKIDQLTGTMTNLILTISDEGDHKK